MQMWIKLFFISAILAALMGCGGASDMPIAAIATATAPAATVASAPDLDSSPVYLVTDGSCASVFTSGVNPVIGKIDDVAVYFGNFSVTMILTGETATFSIQSPGTATLKGVTRNIASVCSVAAFGANWRRVSFANNDAFNIDMSTAFNAKPCANGSDFSIDPPNLRGRFSGCKP